MSLYSLTEPLACLKDFSLSFFTELLLSLFISAKIVLKCAVMPTTYAVSSLERLWLSCIMSPWLCVHSWFQSPLSLLKHRSCLWDSLTSRTTQSHSSFVAQRSHSLLWFLQFYIHISIDQRRTLSRNVSSDRRSCDNRHRVAGQLMNPLHTFCCFVTPVEWKQMGIAEGQAVMFRQWHTVHTRTH